jgi:hypothetical protein
LPGLCWNPQRKEHASSQGSQASGCCWVKGFEGLI